MTPMKTKTVLYAAVGAPVVAARKLGDRFTEIRATLSKEADTLGETATKRVKVWASEGEKVVNRISEGKMVDELASKVDFDQVSEQVSKLRDQLEDLLGTWRASFRPEKVKVVPKATVSTPVKTEATPRPAATKTTAAKTTAAKKAPAKKAPAKKTAAKSPAAKTASAKKAAPRAAAQQAS